ncbi:YcaO-like family protein [Streptomyces sp. NPDC059766]|uniref:YcaO-like family protein n=1 Tax=Streptomyces sp. NPDC059766 TaxID=3346940 RepID=UPI003647B754
MKLRSSVPKITGNGPHREITAEATYARMAPHLKRIGVTRVANITGLDRVGIPVYNAIAPRAFDIISVYNGKGATEIDAKTSAIMEAVERFSASLPMRPTAVASYPELEASGRRVLDPGSCNFELHHAYTIDTPISWVEGYDLMHEHSVLVPQFLAGYYMSYHEVPCYPVSTTNGIASGNSMEEAICHALCELVERDDWTMADLISNRLGKLAADAEGSPVGAAIRAWAQERHPSLDPSTLPPRAQFFMEKFHNASIDIEVKNITSATGIPSFQAVVSEFVAESFSRSHHGIGTHPDAEVAVTRAISEVAQSRVVDIQAMREDITAPGQPVEKALYHVRRSNRANPESWAIKPSAHSVRLQDVASHPSTDVMADVRLLLQRLRARGLDQAIVVDLSAPGIPATVVRVIVPGIESWTVDRSKLGPRATQAWNSTLATIHSAQQQLRTADSAQ